MIRSTNKKYSKGSGHIYSLGGFTRNELVNVVPRVVTKVYAAFNGITVSDIRLLKKCSNLKSLHLILADDDYGENVKKILSLKVKMLKIELKGTRETNILNINNNKLKILSISATNHNNFIPKEIFDLKLKSLKIEGSYTLEKTNYFPNLFRYENIFISNDETIFNCLVNGDHEMFLDLTYNTKPTINSHKKLFVNVDENFIIPDTIVALKIKIPMIMYNRETQLKIIILKIMTNLPCSLHFLRLDTSELELILECLKNLPFSLKKIYLNKGIDLNYFKEKIKIPFNTEIREFQ